MWAYDLGVAKNLATLEGKDINAIAGRGDCGYAPPVLLHRARRAASFGPDMKPRILITSSVVPALDRGGGCLALHRHFCERHDFDVAVASRWPAPEGCGTQFRIRGTRAGAVARRIGLARWAENLNYLCSGVLLPQDLLTFALSWKPDAIFSVADDFHAPIGLRLARRLGVPFVINFQDLFACSNFLPRRQQPFPWMVPFLLRRYRRLQDEADAVFHTCEGMRSWFGAAGRGDVLYPLGGFSSIRAGGEAVLHRGRMSLVYAGNCYGPYGEMILRLARRLVDHPRWSLVIFAMGNDWCREDVSFLTQAGVFRGYRPFADLETEFARAGALLTVMSFRPEDRIFMETSFTTKVVDYLACAKPILAWAPEYSSVGHFAAATGAAILVAQPDEDAVIAALEASQSDPDRWRMVLAAAARVAGEGFAPERQHRLFLDRVIELVARS